MKRFLVLLCVLGLSASCASTPPTYLDRALPTSGFGVLDSGQFVYHDSRAGFFGFSQTSAEVLEASIAKRRPPFLDLAGDRKRTLVLSVRGKRFAGPVGFQWECLYRATAVDRYESRGSYTLRPLNLPPDWDFPAFDTGRLDSLQTLPVVVFEGRWRGRPVKILATRGLGLAPQETVQNGWKAFVSEYQRFQIVDEGGQVLGETSGAEGSLVRDYEYRVYDAVTLESASSLAAGLAVVASLPLFLSAVDDYRRGWSPDVVSDPNDPPGLKDWPLFD